MRNKKRLILFCVKAGMMRKKWNDVIKKKKMKFNANFRFHEVPALFCTIAPGLYLKYLFPILELQHCCKFSASKTVSLCEMHCMLTTKTTCYFWSNACCDRRYEPL